MNVGKIERIIRFVLGIVILGIGGYYENYWGLLGLIPLLTGLVGFCPLYFLKENETVLPHLQIKKRQKFLFVK